MTKDPSLKISVPSLAICGWSGSGKTWLLEKLIALYAAESFRVGVIKHDAHKLKIDHEGKNTYRLWQAGAHNLLAHDQKQIFIRAQKNNDGNITSYINSLTTHVDFVLIEGHKFLSMPKIWLEHPEKPGVPDDVENVLAVLPWGDNRVENAQKIIRGQLMKQWNETPIYAGILTGGKSTRVGFPKKEMQINDRHILRSIMDTVSPYVKETVLLGPASNRIHQSIPCLPDSPDCDGPLAAVLSAFRWNPHAAWIFLACDLPKVQHESIQWLTGQRRFGKWAVIPKDETFTHPLFAVYEPMCASLFEQIRSTSKRSLRNITTHEKMSTPAIPTHLVSGWSNCNTPEDLEQCR